jgi:hypothetical protein
MRDIEREPIELSQPLDEAVTVAAPARATVGSARR